MTEAILLSVAGLVGLAIGGELLVRGSVGIAEKLGVSTLFTGLVIVGFATSMPEMVASVQASLAGSPEIAWGNIVGSNLANTLLILGVSALVMPIALIGTGRRDAVVALGVTLLLWALAWSQLGARWIGFALLAGILVYIVWRYRHPGAASIEEEDSSDKPTGIVVASALFLVGLGILVAGGNALVTGAISLATIFKVPETVIGLTVVAIGTSLPELAASIAAALRGKSGLAIGNVLGSNIYNILLIGGATMSIAPFALPQELVGLQMALLTASAVGLLAVLWFFKSIGRVLGAVLLIAFAANTALLFGAPDSAASDEIEIEAAAESLG
ncbi:K+-dependent Na+/Ca+ exchanger related-protein [Erythrobacter sp. NAP1]|uniref:calcium/sodium antiporter n=1 Tax=Erythrobacter sp. NAP1 TaxID=237727 RepID=UPI0000686B0B|nr:calcium/sodium antiporter [Erythrobacter sp. NAP1]EAQ29408.1 K+-dependent Na+/Ca+ exchanger related-protein [Erythrobacter sp. NAP1]